MAKTTADNKFGNHFCLPPEIVPMFAEPRYGYDLVGNRLTSTDGYTDSTKIHTSTAGFDVLNRPTTASDGASNPTIVGTSYDGLNRLTYRTDGNHNTSSYHFDNASRLLQLITTDSGNSNGLTTSYAYSNNTPNPTQMADQSGANPATSTTSYAYDGFNRLNLMVSKQGTIQYAYDQLNRRQTMVFGDTNTQNYGAVLDFKQVDYTYDGLSRISTLTHNYLINPQNHTRFNQLVSYNYTGGRLTGMVNPDGTSTAYGYDGANRQTDITHFYPVASPAKGSGFFKAHYDLDNNGNPLFVNESRPVNGPYSTPTRRLRSAYNELNEITDSYDANFVNQNGQAITYPSLRVC